MGLFDSIAGAALSKIAGADQGGMIHIAIEMFNQNGGLAGILYKLKQAGLAEVAASWVGHGENLSISADQVSSILGDIQLAKMAEKLGVSPEMLSAQIAQHLPGIVDKMTPNGEVSAESGSVLNAVLSMLKA